MIADLHPISWYAPLSVAIWGYLTVTAAAFLFAWRPRVHRDDVAYGVWCMALGLVLGGIRSIWLLALSGRPAPEFLSQFQAAFAISPLVAFAAGVSLWLRWQTRERRSRRLHATTDAATVIAPDND